MDNRSGDTSLSGKHLSLSGKVGGQAGHLRNDWLRQSELLGLNTLLCVELEILLGERSGVDGGDKAKEKNLFHHLK